MKKVKKAKKSKKIDPFAVVAHCDICDKDVVEQVGFVINGIGHVYCLPCYEKSVEEKTWGKPKKSPVELSEDQLDLEDYLNQN